MTFDCAGSCQWQSHDSILIPTYFEPSCELGEFEPESTVSSQAGHTSTKGDSWLLGSSDMTAGGDVECTIYKLMQKSRGTHVSGLTARQENQDSPMNVVEGSAASSPAARVAASGPIKDHVLRKNRAGISMLQYCLCLCGPIPC